MNLISCHQARMNWEQYDIGGRLSNSGNYTELVKGLKDKYTSVGCGQDPLMEKCLERELYIRNLQNNISEKTQQNNSGEANAWIQVLAKETKAFNDLGCSAKIQQSKNTILEGKLSEYTALDKERIEAESKYEANKKIFTSVSFLLVVVALLIVAKSD